MTQKDYDRFWKWMETPLKKVPFNELIWCSQQDKLNSLTSKSNWMGEIHRRLCEYTRRDMPFSYVYYVIDLWSSISK